MRFFQTNFQLTIQSYFMFKMKFYGKQKNEENHKSAMPYGTHYYIITAIRNHRDMMCDDALSYFQTFPCHAFKIIPSFISLQSFIAMTCNQE